MLRPALEVLALDKRAVLIRQNHFVKKAKLPLFRPKLLPEFRPELPLFWPKTYQKAAYLPGLKNIDILTKLL